MRNKVNLTSKHPSIEEIIRSGNTEALRRQLKFALAPLYIEVNGKQKTLTEFACEEKQLEILRILSKQREEINLINNDGLNCLHVACMAEEPDLNIIQFLIDKSAPVNAQTGIGKKTALILTCGNKDITIEILATLLKTKGIDLTLTDENQENCLNALVANPNATLEMYKLLIEHDKQKKILTQLNTNGQTALFQLCIQVPLQYEMIELLICNGSKDYFTKDYNSALHGLCAQQVPEEKKAEFLKIFSPLLATTTLVDYTNSAGMTVLHTACSNPQMPCEVVQQLCAKGYDVNKKDRFGETGLHLASKSARLEMMQVLVGNHADVDSKDENNNTPLIQACSYAFQLEKQNYIDAINFLINKGANINETNKLGYDAKKILVESKILDNPTVEFLPFCDFDKKNQNVEIIKKEPQIINEIFTNYFSKENIIKYDWYICNLPEGVKITLTSYKNDDRQALEKLKNIIQLKHSKVHTKLTDEDGFLCFEFNCESYNDALCMINNLSKFEKVENLKIKEFYTSNFTTEKTVNYNVFFSNSNQVIDENKSSKTNKRKNESSPLSDKEDSELTPEKKPRKTEKINNFYSLPEDNNNSQLQKYDEDDDEFYTYFNPKN